MLCKCAQTAARSEFSNTISRFDAAQALTLTLDSSLFWMTSKELSKLWN